MHGIQILLSNSSIKQIEFLSNKRELNRISSRVGAGSQTCAEKPSPATPRLPYFLPVWEAEVGRTAGQKMKPLPQKQFLAPNKSSVTSSQPSR